MKPIFCYHSVGSSPLCINQNVFYKQIKYLYDRGYKGCSISELLNNSSNTQKRRVGITFDDCFMSAYINAVPILEKFKFTATFYSALDYRDMVLWGSPSKQRWSFCESSEFTIPFTFMRNIELRSLVNQGMEVGAHTISHENLDTLSVEDQRYQILHSINQLKQVTSSDITSFAFPRGRYNRVSLQILKSSPATNSVTTQSGYLTENSDCYEIPRFAATNSMEHFKSVVNLKYGNLSLYGRIKNRIPFCI